MKKTYAFIDASNIIYGARAEGWLIDLHKLFRYLKKKFLASKAFFYYGKDSKSKKKESFLNKLKQFGYILRVKEIKRYGKRMKANCDVDLTVDAMEEAGKNTEFLIFTGDGDFEYLIKKVIEKGTKVYIVSSNAGVKKPGIITKRLSTKLKTLIRENRNKVYFIEIDSWKMRIRKQI